MTFQEILKNITDYNELKEKLAFVSIFIAIYENMADFVEYNVKSLLCHESIVDGEYVIHETPIYKEKIRKRSVDDKGNKNITKASFLYLKDIAIIDQSDYELFEAIKEVRNRFTHELADIILGEVTEEEFDLFIKLILLRQKISRNWFINVEAPIAGIKITNDIDEDGICSVQDYLFAIAIDVLYCKNEEKYKEILREYNII